MGLVDKLRNRFRMGKGRAEAKAGRASGDPYLEMKGQGKAVRWGRAAGRRAGEGRRQEHQGRLQGVAGQPHPPRSSGSAAPAPTVVTPARATPLTDGAAASVMALKTPIVVRTPRSAKDTGGRASRPEAR